MAKATSHDRSRSICTGVPPLTRSAITSYPQLMASFRSVMFSLSKALRESQRWVIDSFPAIVQRATGHSEQWGLLEETLDEQPAQHLAPISMSVRRYEFSVDISPRIVGRRCCDGKNHSAREDCFFFGSANRDRPVLLSDKASGEETRTTSHANETTS